MHDLPTAESVYAWWLLDARTRESQRALRALLAYVPDELRGRARSWLYEIGVLVHLRDATDDAEGEPADYTEQIEAHLERLASLAGRELGRADRRYRLTGILEYY